MLCKKVVKCKIIGLTKRKRELIRKEYQNLNDFLQLNELDLPLADNIPLYSANKQQALRFYKTIKPFKQYPISIRKDIIQIEKRDTKIAKYWAKIRVKTVKGGIWVAIKPHQSLDGFEYCESKLFPKNDDWWLYITIQKEINPINTHNFLGIDLGIRWSATVCDLRTGQTRFYGKELREIRGKYFYLRKKVNKKKFGDKEKRKTNDLLHKISRNITEWAVLTKSKIVIGDIKDVKNGNKGRRFNRKLGTMPSFKLKQMIKYKANWEGIEVEFTNESYTSKTCSQCGKRLIRSGSHRGLVKCKCGYQDNADRNGALNIIKRDLGYISKLGVVSDQPRTDGVNLARTH